MITELSIIIPTLRVGGLDVVFSSLSNQTCPNFELIIIDSLYHLRRDLVASESIKVDFPVKHFPPIGMHRSNTLSDIAYQRAMNTGLVHTESPIVMFTSDFNWFPADCVQKHIDFHKVNANHAYCGAYDYVKHPALHSNWPRMYGLDDIPGGPDPAWWANYDGRQAYFNKWYDAYRSDLPLALLPFMWSIFDRVVENNFDINSLPVITPDPRPLHPFNPLDPHICYLKHDSFNTNDVVKINGFDEGMDGSHAYQDVEFSMRMHTKCGTIFRSDPFNRIKIMDPHGIMLIRNMQRPETSNGDRFKMREDANFNVETNDWSILSKHNDLYRS